MHRLKKIIAELHPELELSADTELELSADTELIDDGILDSLDIVTLVTDINEAYGINIGAEDISPENFNTVNDISALIARRGGKICG